jgi:ribosomal RNA-processing protein 36
MKKSQHLQFKDENNPAEFEADDEQEYEDYGDNNDDEDVFDSDEGEEVADAVGSKREREDDTDMPLWKRLNLLASRENDEAFTMVKIPTKISMRKKAIDIQDEKSKMITNIKKTLKKEGRSNKNAPAVMKSNKPVRRLRIDADNTTRKSRDPRFAEGSGNLSHDKFLQAYSFLDKYQEDEITSIAQSMKKVRSDEDKEILKGELMKRKQEMTERRRSLKIKGRLSAARAEEREKVKNGKMPFHLDRNAKKVIALEERFDELKGEGKLNSFLLKKRKKNANKDHRWLPSRRAEKD